MSRPNSDNVDPVGYYFFLTFEHSADLHRLTKECQQLITSTDYALTPSDGLHMTLDRISRDGEIAPDQLDAIAAAAQHACQSVPAFTMTIDCISDVHGAFGFTPLLVGPIQNVHHTLQTATLSVYPEAHVKVPRSNPHVTIAYPMADAPTTSETAPTAERINAAIRRIEIPVTEAVMVWLERRELLYTWTVLARIPLVG